MIYLINTAAIGFQLVHCTIICFMAHFDYRLNHVMASVLKCEFSKSFTKMQQLIRNMYFRFCIFFKDEALKNFHPVKNQMFHAAKSDSVS